ncbi:MAG: A/G-specific adenine glycosylase [Candidatus Eremiobacteraeota bacterium]|nr:A/G-specific adenine glycosylase [Candidatus Eremiobacteraeota bacterium]
MKKPLARRLHSRLLKWYATDGRAALPWRIQRNPYYTLVSEFMAQQTQIERVIAKFETFVALFPDVATLAGASTAAVLRAWKGLGYNARAVRLRRVAQIIVRDYGGSIPREATALEQLPGIGPYTAAAIRTFAFGIDDAPIDTNVRRVVGRLFLGPQAVAGTPSEIDCLAHEIVPAGRAHDWTSAMMDLGSTICTARTPKCLLCPLQTECVSAPIDPERTVVVRAMVRTAAQRYESTTRYARGRLLDRLRELPPGRRISLLDLHRELKPLLGGRTVDEVRAFVGALEKDGLVSCSEDHVALPDD